MPVVIGCIIGSMGFDGFTGFMVFMKRAFMSSGGAKGAAAFEALVAPPPQPITPQSRTIVPIWVAQRLALIPKAYPLKG